MFVYWVNMYGLFFINRATIVVDKLICVFVHSYLKDIKSMVSFCYLLVVESPNFWNAPNSS